MNEQVSEILEKLSHSEKVDLFKGANNYGYIKAMRTRGSKWEKLGLTERMRNRRTGERFMALTKLAYDVSEFVTER